MNLITSIIFDFDGTLADTATVIVDTMRRTFTDMGVSSNFVSADFRKMRTDSFQKSRTTRFRKIRVVR